MNTLTNFLTENVQNAIRVQQQLDETFEKQLKRLAVHQELIENAPPFLVNALMPRRMQISSFEISCDLKMGRSKEVEFSLGVQTTPFRFHALYGRNEEEQSHIKIEVQQVLAGVSDEEEVENK